MRVMYLIRFDDICETMNWSIWKNIENILIKTNCRPILSVVPDNQDKVLKIDQAEPRFWEHVRRWQSMGWTIGLHGYQHRFVTQDSGLIRANRYSEFAGLPAELQRCKITKGIQIFKSEGIKANIFVAPAHSFDLITIRELRKIGIRCISDGFFLFPHLDSEDMMWIPQQLWRFYRMPIGVWTICFHHNNWKGNDLLGFHRTIVKNKHKIVDVNKVIDTYGNRHVTCLDSMFARSFLIAVRLKSNA